MSAPMRISLRAGERIYVNGAVLRAERKLTLELLNNAHFLLENHIIQAEEATTPLRQLYFALQTLLIEPNSNTARDAYLRIYAGTRATFSTTDIIVGLRLVGRLVDGKRIYEALKTLRGLFAVEATILIPANASLSDAGQEQHNGRDEHSPNQQRNREDFGERRRRFG